MYVEASVAATALAISDCINKMVAEIAAETV